MFRVFLCLPISLFMIFSVSAKTFVVEKSERIAIPAEQLAEKIIDYENYCSSGCKYKLSNVARIEILERPSECTLFTWMYVKNVKDSKTFHKIVINDQDPENIVITSSFPSLDKRKKLSRSTGNSHSTIFQKMDIVWRLKEVRSGGKFSTTEVSYKIVATSNSSLASLFGKRIKKEMRKSALELIVNLKK